MFSLRAASNNDLEQIMEIIAQCQQLLRSRGVDQWQDGYPTKEAIEDDIEHQQGYLLLKDGAIAAYGAIVCAEEPAYTELKGGRWLSQQEYITLHRLAVANTFRGKKIGFNFFKMMEQEAVKRKIYSLRADTHRDNVVMLRLLEFCGFTLCGDVYYRGSHRFAFEKVLMIPSK
ncbi:MAG: GNAT family N-acetyltransferase [Rikenellaceae bacterium]